MTVRFILAELRVCLITLTNPEPNRIQAKKGINSTAMTEHQPFDLVAKLDGCEIRYYPKYVLVQVKTRGEFASAANRAFGPLVNYISGRNKERTKFAMTAPVIHLPNSQATEHLVSFVLPAGTELKDIPLPIDAEVKCVEVAPHYAAAIKFRGLATYEHFNSLGTKLREITKAAGLQTVGDPYYARFDPPWKPGFLRHNEALIALADYPSKGK